VGDSELFISEHGSHIDFTRNFNNGDSGYTRNNEGESILLKKQYGGAGLLPEAHYSPREVQMEAIQQMISAIFVLVI